MEHTVTVYSTPTCSWCQIAKDHLRSSGIAFEDVDVATDMSRAKEMVEKSGQYGVPVIDIDGEIVVGFDRARIDSLLEIH
ncbi:glutaredoxin family protein [Candidatus Bipolaricaulota bacterium]|jgi:glutaredoxin-like YruB-family protein|nr:glutaredoxin family protein [Candidatus Bipolaricaulota bacterium]TFH11305.1 MAG: glutaredoxin family protein [Candidatus Atribacteria bacterium]